ncbi:unnamed protein product [Adineta steineri]|uniref:Uncharacterized protein n=1 Tax=Adineta steineri TaxID=433720 RepID=A0A814LM71_9BILA|nr:unnamed protein product [Adineta steineri]CAF1067736.1 unnamed protein product [Adineta steineri]
MNVGMYDKPSKVHGVYTERYSLCNELTLLPDINRHRRQNFQRMDFIITASEKLSDEKTISTMSPSQHQQSSIMDRKLNELEFLYSKILRDILFEDVRSTQSEMVDFCRQIYADDPAKLNEVEEFEEYYTSQLAIFWYTRDTFLYRLLNKALRERDIKTLYSLRYFIKDLYLRLKELQNSQSSSRTEYKVYRGQLMDNAEFDTKIRDNINGFFSINSFLSTTQSRDLALVYSGSSHSEKITNEQCVLFEISIDNRIDESSYADISKQSAFGEAETEVLLTMGVTFRINSLVQDNNEHVWIVQLELSDEKDKHLHKIKPTIMNDIAKPYEPLVKLIRLMCRMSFLKEAEYFSRLALEDDSITSNIDLLSLVYYQLGIIYKSTRKIDEAMVYFEKTLDVKHENHVLLSDPSLSNLYCNLGTVYEDKGEYDRAYSYHYLALKVLLNTETIDQADLAIKYSNIASICRKKKDYRQSLQNYTSCLDIETEILPPDDNNLLITKNNMGVVYIKLEDYTEAIELFQEVITTKDDSSEYLSNNPLVALIYWNLACAFYQQGQLTEALKHFRNCESTAAFRLKGIFHERQVTECKDWIHRIEEELSKESFHIWKGYEPDTWTACHPYNMSFTLN